MAVKTNIDMVSIMREGLSNGQGVKYKRLSDVMERGILEGLIEPGRKLDLVGTLGQSRTGTESNGDGQKGWASRLGTRCQQRHVRVMSTQQKNFTTA